MALTVLTLASVVATGADDSEIQAGTWSNSILFPYVGKSGGSDYKFAMRFRMYATAASGFTNFFLNTYWLDPPVGLQTHVIGESADSAAAITSTSDYNSRTRTTAYKDITWPSPTTYESTQQRPVDVTDIVNEVFARAGWSSGNYLQFFLEPTASGGASTRMRVGARDWTSAWGMICVTNTNGGGGLLLPVGMNGGFDS